MVFLQDDGCHQTFSFLLVSQRNIISASLLLPLYDISHNSSVNTRVSSFSVMNVCSSVTAAARSSSHGRRGVTLCWLVSPLSPSSFRWSLRSPPPPLLLSTSWRPSPTATSRLPASRSWSARARWRSTRRTRRWRPSRSAWDRASREPASTWRASCGKRRRTVSRLPRRQHCRQLQKNVFIWCFTVAESFWVARVLTWGSSSSVCLALLTKKNCWEFFRYAQTLKGAPPPNGYLSNFVGVRVM